MPNHCRNSLCVVDRIGRVVPSSKMDMRTLLETNIGFSNIEDGRPIIHFHGIIPMPEFDAGNKNSVTSGLFRMPDWYEWRVENWGTKWDAYEGEWLVDHHMFSTAWSPPLQVIYALAVRTQQILHLQYKEEGMGLLGEYWVNGRTKTEKTKEYDISDSKSLPPHILYTFSELYDYLDAST